MNNINDLGGKGFEKCTSCQACYAVCSQKAIKIVLNNDGFYRPVIDENICVNCGLCKKVCYRYDENVIVSSENSGVWACRCGDENILDKVSSGGVSYMLSNLAVQNGLKVLGVAYDYEKNIAEARISDDIEEFIGSKYIQSYTADAYSELFSDDKTQKYMVFGLPCQIYAIDKYAKSKGIRENLVLVDLFCHGCPSMLAWKKCVEDLKEKCQVKSFEQVEFRSKKNKWHEFCVYCQNGSNKYLTKNEFYAFYELFFSNQILNEACNDCALRGSLNYSDIRIGDFWGYDYDKDRKGVSVVVTVTDSGKEWLDKLPSDTYIKVHRLLDATVFQSFGTVYNVDNEMRKWLLDNLKGEQKIDSIVKQYISRMPIKKKAVHYIKFFISFLPFSVKTRLKRIVHKKSVKNR